MVQKRFLGYFGLVNGLVAWNMSRGIPGIIRTKDNNQMWRVCMADLMLQWKDLYDISNNSPEGVELLVGHEQQPLGKNGKVSAQNVWFADLRQAFVMDVN